MTRDQMDSTDAGPDDGAVETMGRIPTAGVAGNVAAGKHPRRRLLRRRRIIGLLVLGLVVSGCSAGSPAPRLAPSAPAGPSSPATGGNIYAATGAGMFQPATRGVPYRLYVPNHSDGTVTVIDPVAKRVIDTYPTGPGAQHVVPGWDLRTLWAANNENGNSLTPIDPRTGRRRGPNVAVADPYNLYFTPDGRSAIVVAEAQQQLNFADPQTFRVQDSVPVSCAGLNHIDFSADSSYFIATCEFSSQLVKVDTRTHRVLGYLTIPDTGMPQDIKLDPTGRTFYVSDMKNNGVHILDGQSFRLTGFLPTGPETHGLYVSRDARSLYIANRGGMGPDGDRGSVSVLDFASGRITAMWPIPAPSTPDMGNVSPDGGTLWLSGRRTDEVYGIDTTSGRLTARIKVGREPHGLAVWPQPGRYSLGHTGILR